MRGDTEHGFHYYFVNVLECYSEGELIQEFLREKIAVEHALINYDR